MTNDEITLVHHDATVADIALKLIRYQYVTNTELRILLGSSATIQRALNTQRLALRSTRTIAGQGTVSHFCLPDPTINQRLAFYVWLCEASPYAATVWKAAMTYDEMSGG